MIILLSLILSVVVFSLNLGSVSANCCDSGRDRYLEFKKQAIEHCKAKHSITDDQVREVMNHKSCPDEENVKKFLRCYYRRLGMLKDRKLDWELSKKVLVLEVGEQFELQAENLIVACRKEVTVVATDRAVLAFLYTQCKIKYWKESGLPVTNQ